MTQNTSLTREVTGTRESDRGTRGTRRVAHSKPHSVSSVPSVHPCFRTLLPRSAHSSGPQPAVVRHIRPQPFVPTRGPQSPVALRSVVLAPAVQTMLLDYALGPAW